MKMKIPTRLLSPLRLLTGFMFLGFCHPVQSQTITVSTLLSEMTDFRNLATSPSPWFKQAQASSYDRKSHDGGDSWFANYDVGQYVRAETNDGRKEQVLADLAGPGTISRFWSANPDLANAVHFYFDGEKAARLVVPLHDLFTGSHPLFKPEFSYISGTGGNLYFPIPYDKSLKVTIEDPDGKLRLYYEIGFRTYSGGAKVETFDPGKSSGWREAMETTARNLAHPGSLAGPADATWQTETLTIPPGESRALPQIRGEEAVFSFSARVAGMKESDAWTDPKRAHVALRHLLLEITFDDQAGIRAPLGDFFGSGPGLNPYENLYFTVAADGWMTSRLLMPFRKSMRTEIYNAGSIPYTIELKTGHHPFHFTPQTYYLHAQWGTLSRESWPPFDINFLQTTGEGKVVGTVYQVSNPSYIWWGEGDQKIFIDGEPFPSSFGTGTEDDYGYAYGNNELFTRPYHAQTRVDGPASGGHISLNRWYVLDALPYKSSMRFDQEIWHWMPCTGVWSHVIYWYAKPGTPGPQAVDRQSLMPIDLGIRSNMLELIEGEDLAFEIIAGTARTERLANCSGARHLVWRDAKPGDRIRIHFNVPTAGKYQVIVNLCMSPDYGKYRFKLNDLKSDAVVDAWSEKLYWMRPVLGSFHLNQGANILEVELLEPNPSAKPGNLFGLDYLFLTRMDEKQP
jgi:hypothetical protein